MSIDEMPASREDEFVTLIRRGSVLLMLGANFKVSPSLSQAFQTHADALGKPLEELTVAEKRQAWIIAVMEAYDESRLKI